jgi:hypothetical protein
MRVDNTASSVLTALIEAGNIDTVYRDVYLDHARTVLAANANSIAYGRAKAFHAAGAAAALCKMADTVLARMASCAVALIAARRGERTAP